MPKRRKDKEPVPVMPQRFTWKTEATFTDFSDAAKYQMGINQKNKPSKIKRRKDSFDVRVGTPTTKKD